MCRTITHWGTCWLPTEGKSMGKISGGLYHTMQLHSKGYSILSSMLFYDMQEYPTDNSGRMHSIISGSKQKMKGKPICQPVMPGVNCIFQPMKSFHNLPAGG